MSIGNHYKLADVMQQRYHNEQMCNTRDQLPTNQPDDHVTRPRRNNTTTNYNHDDYYEHDTTTNYYHDYVENKKV